MGSMKRDHVPTDEATDRLIVKGDCMSESPNTTVEMP